MNTMVDCMDPGEYEMYRSKRMSLYQKHAYAYTKEEQEEKKNEPLRNK